MSNETQSSRFGFASKAASIFLSAAIIATTFTGLGTVASTSTEVDAASTNEYGLMEHAYDGVILHCWNWSFNAIKENMQAIAEAGYTSVQTSPVQRPKDYTSGSDQTGWWKVYQPTTLCFAPDGHPWFGTKAEFQAMCDEAEKYGIKVIVDVVANHMANDTGSKGNTTSDISYQNDPTFRDDTSCWHLNGSTYIDYGNQHRNGDTTSLTYGFGGWPDLNTGSTKVQTAVINLLKECIDLGADGFRFDAAKHIELPTDPGGASDFWPNVINGANSYAESKGVEIYCYGEILDDSATEITNYTKYIAVTDNRAGNSTRYGVRDGDIGKAANSSLTYNGVEADKLVLWAESHDTYANDNFTGESASFSQDQINRTWAIVAAREFAALYYIRPSNTSAQMGTASGNTSWKNKEVAEVNKFHNAFSGQSEYMSSSGNCVLVERGTEGVVIVNISGNSQQFSAKVNKMADGTYTDQVTGNKFTVSGGQISGQIGSTGIAVVYNPDDIVTGSVSASPSTGTSFTDTLTVTLSAKDVTNAKYTTSEGASGSYTNGQTITVGASTSVGSSVTVTVSGTKSDGSSATATYTYSKKDPNAVTTIYFDNTSYNWDNVYVYVYNGSGSSSGGDSGGSSSGGDSGGGSSTTTSGEIYFTDSLNWGTVYAYFFNNSGTCGLEWPGTQMTSYETNPYGQTNYKVSIPSGATSVVFNNNNGTQTGDLTLSGVTGYYLDGSADNAKPWASTSSSTSAVSVIKTSSSSATTSTVTENAAWPGVKMTKNAEGLYEYTVPDNLVNGYVMFSDGTDTASKRYPADGETGLKLNDTSMKFSAGNKWEEYTPTPVTTDPSVTANKASGTTFTTETLDVTLTLANATSGTYSVDNGPVKSFTGSKTITIGEGKIGDTTVTVTTTATGSDGTTKTYTFTYEKDYVVKTSSSSATSLSSKYATNPNNQYGGSGVTITSPSDFKESMIIAQGVANDDPRIFRGSHEAPVYDTYALYAAWDDTNLYLGWQFTNVTDVVDPAQGYPISDNGKPWNGDIPQMLAFDLGTGNSADMSNGTMSNGYIWGLKVGFETDIDALMCFSSKPGVGEPALFKTGSDGYFNYTNVTGFTAGGISFKYEDGFFGSSLIGIKSNGYSGYVPDDLLSESSAWTDFLNEGHSTAQDTFYYMTIPLSTLGITREYLENTGIGVMHISTFGEGGIASIPMDMTMLDNATTAYSADESTSAEKEDTDTITVSLARIGAGGDNPPVTTPLQVNFGTDRSAPQLTTTALTLSAVGYGGTAPYQYQFYVDGTSVKSKSTTSTYTWTPSTSGSHTIKCVITDSTGATATVSKTFTAESNGIDVEDLVNNSIMSATSITLGNSVTLKGAATGGTSPYQYAFSYKLSSDSVYTSLKSYSTTASYTWKPSKAGTYSVCLKVKDSTGTEVKKFYTLTVKAAATLTNSSTMSATSITLGNSVTLKGAATGGTTPYQYAYSYKLSTASVYTSIRSYSTTASYAWTPSKAGTYSVCIKVKDSTGTEVKKFYTLTVKAAALTNNSTMSASAVALGNSVTITGSATGGPSPYQYACSYKLSSDSAYTSLKSYSTTASYTWKPSKVGTYSVCLKVKDSAGTEVKKFFTFTVNSASTLTNGSTISATSITNGSTVKLNAVATGGTSPYQYAYSYKLSSASTYTSLSNYSTISSYTWQPADAGTYSVCIKVKDSAGTESKVFYTVTVK